MITGKSLNPTLQTIYDRASSRSYKPDMITDSELEAVLLAGISAPSGKNTQPIKLIAIKNKEDRDYLESLNREIIGQNVNPFYGAPVVILVLAKKDDFASVEDGSLAIENMLVAAHSLNLGSIWIHRAKEEMEDPRMDKILNKLNIKREEYRGIGHVLLGYSLDTPRAKTHKKDMYVID